MIQSFLFSDTIEDSDEDSDDEEKKWRKHEKKFIKKWDFMKNFIISLYIFTIWRLVWEISSIWLKKLFHMITILNETADI